MAATAGGHGCGWGGLWDMLPKAGQFFPELIFGVLVAVIWYGWVKWRWNDDWGY